MVRFLSVWWDLFHERFDDVQGFINLLPANADTAKMVAQVKEKKKPFLLLLKVIATQPSFSKIGPPRSLSIDGAIGALKNDVGFVPAHNLLLIHFPYFKNNETVAGLIANNDKESTKKALEIYRSLVNSKPKSFIVEIALSLVLLVVLSIWLFFSYKRGAEPRPNPFLFIPGV